MIREVVLLVLALSLLVVLPVSATSKFVFYEGFLDKYNVEAENYSSHISVPFHYQNNNYYCGPAALEMVFDYYGEDVPQTEIADVARTYPYVTFKDELRRAALFSNESTSRGDEILDRNITGYSTRRFGYAAFEQWGLTIDDLKSAIDKREPVIVLMWWTPSKNYGHYRVVVGYNETHLIMHDPWNKDAWGGLYGGANTSMTKSTFLDLWEYVGYWGLLVCPWDLEVQVPETVVEGENFEVAANMTYTCLPPFDTGEYPASSCNATIKLTEGLKLGSGETAQHQLGSIPAGNLVHTSWTINANETGSYNVSVRVAGIVEGGVGAHGNYSSYNYEDAIGGSCTASLSITSQTRRVHNLNTGYNYTTVQEAINADETKDGHTIFVEQGIYYEHVIVNKTLSLIGEYRNGTIIDGNGTGVVISAVKSNAAIKSFTIRNGSTGIRIYLSGVGECCNITIQNNLITNMTGSGIWVFAEGSNKIVGNTISNCWSGINLSFSCNNTITHNFISKNKKGISSGLLIVTKSSSGSGASEPNRILHNKVVENECGINITNRGDEIIFHNNFVHNIVQAYVLRQFGFNATNIWDNNLEGNYWSDYTKADLNSGPYQNESGSDGIGDIPYIINETNQDNYPLMGLFYDFNATSEQHIQTTCNSSISDFQFNGTAISFNVSGENKTTGFCRICIPKALMNGTYKVFVNGTEVEYDILSCSNATHNFLYFAYNHSTQKVTVIPEFPSSLILPLLMTVTLLAVTIYRRKTMRASKKESCGGYLHWAGSPY